MNCTVQPSRLLDWFHILRTQHIKEELVNKGLPLPKPGAVIPQMELREAKMPFPSGKEYPPGGGGGERVLDPCLEIGILLGV